MKKPEELYLDLLKKALTYYLWPEPPMPVETFSYTFGPVKRLIAPFIASLLRLKRLQLVKQLDVNVTMEQREDGKYWPWPILAETMIGIKRLDNIQFCVETIIRDSIEGDLIETGVWRGGACIFMRAILAAYNIENRKVYVADSFEGLPKPDVEKWPDDKGDTYYTHAFLAVSQDYVENNFRRYGLLDDQVVFLKGWFKDTLPAAPIENLAVLRLDGDMYGSTMDALTNLYPKVSKGGFCIIDDYGALPACKQAVNDYRAANGIDEEIKAVDYSGVYWRKE